MLTFFVLYVKLKLAKKFQKDVLTLNEILKEIGLIGIVPVVKIDNAEDAVPLAKALISGGLPCAEITFRTAAAEQAIKNIAEQCPEMLVGAGTVLTKEQALRDATESIMPYSRAIMEWNIRSTRL